MWNKRSHVIVSALTWSHQSVIRIQKLHFHFMAPSSACAVLRSRGSHADLTIFGTVHVRGHRTVQTLITAFYHVTNVKAGAVIGRGIATSAAPRIDLPTQPAESFSPFRFPDRYILCIQVCYCKCGIRGRTRQTCPSLIAQKRRLSNFHRCSLYAPLGQPMLIKRYYKACAELQRPL
jgi:hypothetical protein